jgi:hypothetical protein
MTGKQLIIYILQNNLEDEEIFKDGVFIGIMDEKEAAARFNVGTATIRVWYMTGMLRGFEIGEELYFPRTIADPRKDV